MKRSIIYMFLLFSITVYGQEERKYIREGYKSYMDGEYNEAEIDFRKAEDANTQSYEARYNTSAALYQQDKLEESGKKFSNLLAETNDTETRAKLFHNMGNVFLKGQKYQEAAEAFKQSLRLNPEDEDTRYNLTYALEKLREQQQQQQQQQDKNQDNQDQQDQDQQQQNQDGQQDDQQQQQQQEEQQQNDQQQQEQQQAQEQEENGEQQKQALSQEEAERLLQAILQKEKDVKEKVDKQKAKSQKVKTDKDW